MNDTAKIDIVAANSDGRAEYDAQSKKIFKHKSILAPILKYVVEEYADYDVKEIEDFIDADTRDDVYVSDIDDRIEARGTEKSSPTEKLSFFDLKLKAKNPKLSDGRLLVMLHIDMEFHRDYKPSYPVVKRAVYYVARDISEQLGSVTKETDYNALEKVYSIWIIHENIPPEEQNSISRYRFHKEDLVGTSLDDSANYDLMEVVLIRRGDTAPEGDSLLDYLDAIFSSDLERLERYTDDGDDLDYQEARKEIKSMGGYSGIIADRAKAEGLATGRSEGETRLAKLIALLFEDGRSNDIQKAAVDEEARKEFYRQYGIID